MKQNERVIKKGDYYELQTIEDLMMQQKISKKQQPQSSTNIPIANQNIVTELVPRSEAIKNYQVGATGKVKTENYGLLQYESSLQLLLKQPIKDQQRLEIQKLLGQIASIKNDAQLPLNQLPVSKQQQKSQEAPKKINLVSQFNTQNLSQNLKNLQNIKYIELSRLQQIVDILLNQQKVEPPAQQNSTQIDEKTKQQIETAYNNLSQLKCLNNLIGIVNKISSNQSKYTQMNNWMIKIDQANTTNKQILDQFQNDDLVLKQLQQNFKKNIQAVRGVIKKLSQ